MKKIIGSTLIFLLALSSNLQSIKVVNAAQEQTEVNQIVDKISSVSTGSFVITTLDCAEGAGVTLTQEAKAFEQDYLALRLYLSYVENANNDQYLPFKLHINGKHIATDAKIKAIDYKGEAAEDVDLKWGGYIFLTPKFNGTLYLPKTLIDESSINSIKLTFDGTHNAELAVMSVYQCKAVGEKLGEVTPVVDPYNVQATADAGTTVKNNMVIEEATGDAGNGAHLTFKEADFSSKYLAVDMTVLGVGSDPYVVTSLKVNGNVIGTNDTDIIPFTQRSNLENIVIENKWPTWFFIPGGFDGTLYLEKSKFLNGVDKISSMDVLFDGAGSHSGTKIKINSVFGVDTEGGTVSGKTYEYSEGATINETTTTNTVGNVTASVNLEKTTLQENDYLAVYMDLKSGAPAGDFTYIGFSVDDRLLPEMGNVPYYPTGGEASSVEHKWGNWVVAPDGTKGVFYFKASTYGITGISKFTFVYDGGHTNELDYRIGVAHELGGEVSYIAHKAASGQKIVEFDSYLPEATYAEKVFDLAAIHYDDGAVDDESVTKDDGVLVFDSFSYITKEFGGVYLQDDYVDQLVIYVKSQNDGGAPMAIPNDYGFLEINLGESGFNLADGFAVNVQCFSTECYFRLILIDENGGYWACNYAKTYQLVQNGVPLGIATLYENFYYGEDYYGTLFVSKDNLINLTEYNGVAVDAKSEIGKIVKVGVSMDMLYGLGRKMSIGVMANVDLENGVITRVMDLSNLTEEEFNAAIILPGDEAHNANFALSREALEDTPYYEEEECQHVDADNDGICDKCEEVIGKTSVETSEEPSAQTSVVPSQDNKSEAKSEEVKQSEEAKSEEAQPETKKKGCKGEAATSLIGLLSVLFVLKKKNKR